MKIAKPLPRTFIFETVACINLNTGSVQHTSPDNRWYEIKGFLSFLLNNSMVLTASKSAINENIKMIQICAWCCPDQTQKILQVHDWQLSHGICQNCSEKVKQQLGLK